MLYVYFLVLIALAVPAALLIKHLKKRDAYHKDHASGFRYGYFTTRVDISFEEFLKVYPVIKDRVKFEVRKDSFGLLECPRVGCCDDSFRGRSGVDGYQIVFPKADIMTFRRWYINMQKAIIDEAVRKKMYEKKQEELENLRSFLTLVQVDIERMQAKAAEHVDQAKEILQSIEIH